MTTNSSMASRGAADQGENQHDRKYYIKKIIEKLYYCSSRSNSLPTSTQERSMEEALKYLVPVLSSNECLLLKGISSCGSTRSTCSTTWNRKRCLKEIMKQLSLMERQCFYNPPTDHEIPYYLLIKKYIRSILAFFFNRALHNGAAVDNYSVRKAYGFVSLFQSLHFVEEMADSSHHLVDLSELLLLKGINDDFTLKPVMDTEDGNKITLPIHGSKERSYRFYFHKFKLAFIDLQSYEHAILTPTQDEKTSYLQVLDSFAVPLIEVQDEMSTLHSNMLNQLFLERVDLETRDYTGHCEKIIGWILKDLSLNECWQSIKEIYDEVKYERIHPDGYLTEVKKPLVEQCKVSEGDLLNYISRLDRSLRIAEIMVMYVNRCYEESTLSDELDELDAWEALHALTIFLNCGSSIKSIVPQQLVIDNSNNHVSLDLHYRATSENELPTTESKDENVQLLTNIVEDLKRIGDLTAELDKEEVALVRKIWQNVASSTHFFFSALAYEQRRYLMHHSELLNDEILRLSQSSRRTENVGQSEVEHMWVILSDDVTGLRDILEVYKKALDEKMKLQFP